MKAQLIWRIPLIAATIVICTLSFMSIGNVQGFNGLLFAAFVVTLLLAVWQFNSIEVFILHALQKKTERKLDMQWQEIRKSRIIATYKLKVKLHNESGTLLAPNTSAYDAIYNELANIFGTDQKEIKKLIFEHIITQHK